MGNPPGRRCVSIVGNTFCFRDLLSLDFAQIEVSTFEENIGLKTFACVVTRLNPDIFAKVFHVEQDK